MQEISEVKDARSKKFRESFGSKQVLFGIDFQARPGRILGLVGKNGAGKQRFSIVF